MEALRRVTVYDIEVCKGGRPIGVATVRATTAYAAVARAMYEAKRDGMGAVSCGMGMAVWFEDSTDSAARVVAFREVL